MAMAGGTSAVGVALALGSAVSFGLSGPLAAALIEAGWSPPAVAFVRMVGGALVLCVPTAWLLMRNRPTARQRRHLLVYGLVAVAGVQLGFFNAISHVDVAVAILVEYTAPVLIVGFDWARTRERPHLVTVGGAVVALAGLVLVLDVRDLSGLNIGLAWAALAAVCLATYFVMSDATAGEQLPPTAMTGAGLVVGSGVVGLLGLVGVLPLQFTSAAATIGGVDLEWWALGGLLALVSTVVAYLLGIVSVRLLGAQPASFLSLTEALFATAFAALLLGQQLTWLQAVGAVLVIGGIVVVQLRARTRVPQPDQPPTEAVLG